MEGEAPPSRPTTGFKQPRKRIPSPPVSEEEEEEHEEEVEEEDPFVKALSNAESVARRAEDARRRAEQLCTQRHLKRWKTDVCNLAFITFDGKMRRALRNHINGQSTQVALRSTLEQFQLRRNFQQQQEVRLFVFELKHGQRNQQETLSVYGILSTENIAAASSTMIPEDDIFIELFVDGEYWDQDETFYNLMRFILRCSGKRADDEQDGGIADFSRFQLVILRNAFIEILVNYMRTYVDELNRSMRPTNQYPSANFVMRCIEEKKY